MCALFLGPEGGAGGMPWRERPSSVMTRNGGGHFEVGGGPLAVFPDVIEGPTIEETGMARVADIAVQEKTGSQSSTLPELDDEPKKPPRKRSRSISADIETDMEDKFSTEFYNHLQEEARQQESLESTTVWSKGRELLKK